MRSQGTVDVKLSDVAREMRMSAPGLYRYFDGREGLLLALITDAMTDLAERVEKARDGLPAIDPGGRFLAVALAYRQWAIEDREGFTLVFGPALVDFDKVHEAHAQVMTTPDKAAALRGMEALRSLSRDADESGIREPLPLSTLPPALVAAFSNEELHGADPATELAMVHCWASLHGFVTLEVNGHLNWHGEQVREEMFLGLVRVLLRLMGLPQPTGGWPAGTPAP
jgi:AcrR family transcriptional regulator